MKMQIGKKIRYEGKTIPAYSIFEVEDKDIKMMEDLGAFKVDEPVKVKKEPVKAEPKEEKPKDKTKK